MKVKELITRLQACDPESIVVVDGYEGGVTELEAVTETTVGPYPEEAWYYGEYEAGEGTTPATYLSRA